MGNTHEKIINAAKELFSTKGYAATTTKDIANQAGISEVTLFRHFDSKRNLFQTALHDTMDSYLLINFFEKELTYDLETDLKKLSEHLHILYLDNGPLIKMMLKDIENNTVDKLSKPKLEKKVKKHSDAYFEKMYELGKIADDPALCRRFFFHNAIGFLMRRFVMGNCEDGDDYYNWMIDKTISAIKN